MKFIFLFLLHFFTIGTPKECYWNSECFYKYFSSKTPYNSVRGDIRDSKVKLKGCEPVSIWGMYRHGKRKPSTIFSEKMIAAIHIRDLVIDSYKMGRSSLCAQDVENLQNWEYYSEFFDGIRDINEEGRKEMMGLGKRFKEAFPELLKDLPKGSYTLRPAKDIWIQNSMDSFVSGLGNPNLDIDETKPVDVMSPYTTSSQYLQNVKAKLNSNVYAEYERYLNTSEYLVTKDGIQRRSGVEYILTDENITALYDLCRYTWSAVDSKISPWCALFTNDDLEILEYAQDLRHYYRNSYGTAGNEVFGRVPLGDLFMSFENCTKGGGKKIIAYISHATMLDHIYTSLGLFKDAKQLTGAHRDPERIFRTSKISVFSTNLVAVLNRCIENDSELYNVVFYLNEEPLRSICDEGVCSWKEFDVKFRPFVNATIDFLKGLPSVRDNPENIRCTAADLDRKKCYDTLGCISVTPEWKHPKYRPVNILPAERHSVNTIFVHWVKRESNVTPEIIGTNGVNFTNSDLKLLVHDFTSNGYSGWIQHLSRLLLLNPHSSLSVVSVDWAAGAEPPYVQAIANARLVALEIKHFLENVQITSNVKPRDVHIIGHGVGAHIAGYVGKMNRLKQITALDPAGLYFENMPAIVRLYKMDATFIEVLHTNAFPRGQGNKQLLGHVDFFANGGIKQPGCKDTLFSLNSIKRGDLKLGETLPGCSHKRSLKYYLETLINQSCMFLGVACKSYNEFLEGKCTCGVNMENCWRLNSLRSPRTLNNMAYGYYFVTSSSHPFCGEMLKVVISIQSGASEELYVNGYFNITIPQSIGDVSFLINENSIVSALRTNTQHSFLVFRTTPPPLILPIDCNIHLEWLHRPLACFWCTPPKITSFMIQKMTDNKSDRPQLFCATNSPSINMFDQELQQCKETSTP